MSKPIEWLKTTEAARRLNISAQTLMRARDDRGGFLPGGTDYIYGQHENSPIRWNIQEVEQQFHLRGRRIRQGKAILQGA